MNYENHLQPSGCIPSTLRIRCFDIQIIQSHRKANNGPLEIHGEPAVPPQLEGQGIAQALTEAAVRYASVVGLKIRPTCSFAKMFFTRHTQYKDMLVE